MKLKALGLALLLILLASVSVGTLAYFTADTTAHNVVTSGGVEIALVETMLDKKDPAKEIPFTNADGVMPGQNVSKIVRVENTGVSDAWVRVKLDTTVTVNGDKIKGWEEYINYQVNDKPADDSDKDYWIPGEDGWYYYSQRVPASGKTEPIIREVEFKSTMGNDYQDSRTEINVSAQAVQVANNGTTVMEAQGWPFSLFGN